MGRKVDGGWWACVEIGSKQKIEVEATTPMEAFRLVRSRLEKSVKRREESLRRHKLTMARIERTLWQAAHDMEQYDSQTRKAA